MLPLGGALAAFGLAQDVGLIREFSAGGRLGAAGGFLSDVAGVAQMIDRLFKVADLLGVGAKDLDADALAEMVDLARARAARDTGLLIAGIAGESDDGFATFMASAARDGEEDYALFVEKGTRAGVRGQAVAYATSIGQMRRRKQARTHPGTEAQPFFYNSAREVLARRRVAAEDLLDEAAAAF